uniref:Uncharacterized protein n=1 Tax=Rhizophora mucronata TaxID=61149 RepID=A0A2P2QKM1_RHIMU
MNIPHTTATLLLGCQRL